MQVQRHISVKKVITVQVVQQQRRLLLPHREEANAPPVTIVRVPLLKLLEHLEPMFQFPAHPGPTAQIREEPQLILAQPAPLIITVRTTDPPRIQSVTRVGSVRAVILHLLPKADFAR